MLVSALRPSALRLKNALNTGVLLLAAPDGFLTGALPSSASRLIDRSRDGRATGTAESLDGLR